jgi:hypothetical protein
VRAGRLLALVVLLGSASASASAGAPAGGGLSVWPARATLEAGRTVEVHVANRTGRSASLSVRIAGLVLDLHGGPRVGAASAGTALLVVRPPRLVVRPHAIGSFTLRALAGHGAGDRPALVLVTARGTAGAGIGVRVRVGLPIEVRLPGPVLRRLELGRLRVHPHRLELLVRNRGNVVERLGRGSILLRLRRRGRLVAVLQPRARDLLPHTRGVVDYRVPRRVRGRTTILAVVPGTVPAETRRLNVTL